MATLAPPKQDAPTVFFIPEPGAAQQLRDVIAEACPDEWLWEQVTTLFHDPAWPEHQRLVAVHAPGRGYRQDWEAYTIEGAGIPLPWDESMGVRVPWPGMVLDSPEITPPIQVMFWGMRIQHHECSAWIIVWWRPREQWRMSIEGLERVPFKEWPQALKVLGQAERLLRVELRGRGSGREVAKQWFDHKWYEHVEEHGRRPKQREMMDRLACSRSTIQRIVKEESIVWRTYSPPPQKKTEAV